MAYVANSSMQLGGAQHNTSLITITFLSADTAACAGSRYSLPLAQFFIQLFFLL